jgi:hypothetical protein
VSAALEDVPFAGFQIRIPREEPLNEWIPLEGCEYSEEDSDAFYRYFSVSPGRCLIDVGGGWRVRLQTLPDDADIVASSSFTVVRVSEAAPDLLRVLDDDVDSFEFRALDAESGVEVPVREVAGDCELLPSGEIRANRPDRETFEATCQITVGEAPGGLLTLDGTSGRVFVEPGPASENQIVACTLGEAVSCVDDADGSAVPHPIVYTQATDVEVRADRGPVSFTRDCEPLRSDTASVQVRGPVVCGVRPQTQPLDGKVDLDFHTQGGTIQIFEDGSNTAFSTCAFTQAQPSTACRLDMQPRVFQVRALPDDPYTEFVRFVPPDDVDNVNRFGCEETVEDRFSVDLANVDPGTPPGSLTFACNAEFRCTELAELRSVDMTFRGSPGQTVTLDFDLANEAEQICPIISPSLVRCAKPITASEIPAPYSVDLAAETRGGVRLPDDIFVDGVTTQRTGSISTIPAARVEVELDHCGTTYIMEASITPN